MLGTLALVSVLVFQSPTAGGQQWQKLQRDQVVNASLQPTEKTGFEIALKRGESALIHVLQKGVDVVVDVYDGEGKHLDAIDSPTGRAGNEVVDLIASRDGVYRLSVRPYDTREPAGAFELRVVALRDVRATDAMIAERRRSISEAARWIAQRSTPFRVNGHAITLLSASTRLKLSSARVVGLGEATHGSIEFNSTRFGITKQLVERHGFRVVAVEYSASRAMQLQPYLRGVKGASGEALQSAGWIGSEAYPRLITWIRSWNIAHPRDQVEFVGVDAGDNSYARRVVDAFVAKALDERAVEQWKLAKRELEDADAQNEVFGDSFVDPLARQTLVDLQWRLRADRSVLVRKFGVTPLDQAEEALAILIRFADYNSGAALNQSRDWYMATTVLEELSAKGKAVFWAHNAHVAATPRSSVAGSVLRGGLGKSYIALAQTASEGSFVAQRPNDLADRLETSKFLPPRFASVESALGEARDGAFVALWGSSVAPAFLRRDLPMRWIGGLYQPGSLPSDQFRNFKMLQSFDGVIYLPTVRAIPLPSQRHIVPARVRRYGKG